MLDIATIVNASAVLRNLTDTLGTLWVSCLASLGAAGNVTVGHTLRGNRQAIIQAYRSVDSALSTQQLLYCSSLSIFQSEYSPVAGAHT